MTYNLTLINSTGLLTLTQTVNDNLMFGMFGIMALLSLFVIFMISFYQKTEHGPTSFIYASIICAILSVPMRALSLINELTILIMWTLAALSLLIYFINQR